MADIVVVPADVEIVGAVTLQTRLAGEAVTRGQAVYLKSSDQKFWLADSLTAAEAAAVGIALTSGSADQYIVVVTAGPIDLGATLTVGESYCVSSAAKGGVAPYADVTSGEYRTILGTADAANSLPVNVNATGVAVA